jgi:hypothetical protein
VTDRRPYSRVYHDAMDDPMFERVWNNDKALATWVRMLVMADAMYPVSAPMTTRNPTVRMLIVVGLVIERPGGRYTIRGLEAERERRSAPGRTAAVKRWQYERNANAVPDETRRDEKETSNGANAPQSTGSFMGFRPKAGEHLGQHPDCGVCAPLRPKGAPA